MVFCFFDYLFIFFSMFFYEYIYKNINILIYKKIFTEGKNAIGLTSFYCV